MNAKLCYVLIALPLWGLLGCAGWIVYRLELVIGVAQKFGVIP